MVVVFVGVQLLIAMPLAVLDSLAKTRLLGHGLVLGGINLLAFFGVLVAARLLHRQPLAEHLARGRWLWAAAAPVLVMFTGLHFLVSELDNLVRRILPMPDFFAESMRQVLQPEGAVAAVGTFLTLVVVAPVTEELIFRGILLRGFLRRYGLPKAALFSSLLFGLAHMNPWQFAYTTVIGMLLALVWWRTRSLGLCILAHAVNNLLVCLGAILLPGIPGYSLMESDHPAQFQPWWLDFTGLILTVSGTLWLIRRCRSVPADEGLLPIEPQPVLAIGFGIPPVIREVDSPPPPMGESP
jgi:membrane protease YdiL (CAAX protease family)